MIAAAAPTAGSGLPLWVQVLIALGGAAIATAGSWLISRGNRAEGREDRKQAAESARIAAEQATAVQASSEELERLRRLENRVQEGKVDAYLPMFELLAKLFAQANSEPKSPAQQAKFNASMKDQLATFWYKSLIYSSDNVLRAYGRMQQGFYTDAPVAVTMRLTSEFFIAVRRDIGDERSSASPSEVWAPRINDLFGQASSLAGFDTKPFDELTAEVGWTPPWLGTTLEHRADEVFVPGDTTP